MPLLISAIRADGLHGPLEHSADAGRIDCRNGRDKGRAHTTLSWRPTVYASVPGLREHPFTFRYATPLCLLDVLARCGVPVNTTIHWIWLN